MKLFGKFQHFVSFFIIVFVVFLFYMRRVCVCSQDMFPCECTLTYCACWLNFFKQLWITDIHIY